MPKGQNPSTPATRLLRSKNIPFEETPYDYVEKGGTERASQCLGVPHHAVIKTLVMEDEKKKPLIILMHGDCQVSTKQLARELGTVSVAPCTPETAHRHTGYFVGGTSPFGTKKELRVFVEASILELEALYINGGSRGFLLKLAPSGLMQALKCTPVRVAISG
ncbi:MAG: aminoacyl-tRNA deacylase [Polyangiaceae bacterium]|nr:aminoacyl-tRNA deacylase [Polyangiaceae bacterium]